MIREEATTWTISISSSRPSPRGGAIFSGKDESGTTHRCIAGDATIPRSPAEGEIWTVTGHLETHPEYGRQIRVTGGCPERPTGRLIINYLVNNPAFKGTGIGQKKAARLWREFGEELYTILSKADVTRLTRVLTEETARKLAGAWERTQKDVAPEVFQFLTRYNFDVRLANRVRRVWPVDPVKKIQENPYRMLAFAEWKRVDAVATALGVSGDDPRRQVAAVEASLYRRLDAKHTVTPHELALERTLTTLGTRDRSVAEAALKRAMDQHAIITHAKGYQPLGAAVMERVIAERFQLMLNSVSSQPNLFSTSIDSIIAESLLTFRTHHGISLNVEQEAAVELALKKPLCVLTGGAGVGKTTVLKVVHDTCERIGRPVIQMALSGRAARRMYEATGREALTIAKFLRTTPVTGATQHGDPLIIIDESSMLDLPLAYSIVRALPARANIMLVGDPYQLPPIGFGLVFHVLAESPNVPKVELVHVHRQSESSGIPQVAHHVRHGSVPELSLYTGAGAGVNFINAREHEIVGMLAEIKSSLDEHGETQVLGVTKRGPSGVNEINSVFHQHYSAGRKKVDGWAFAEGDPVIYLVNDYHKELWNGSLGRVLAVERRAGNGETGRGSQVMTCAFDGEIHELQEIDFKDVGLSYAITVHKAQGSQFKRVIIPVVKSHLLDRTLVYTALTRGVIQVVFVGDREAFDEAVRLRPKSHDRMVGFSF